MRLCNAPSIGLHRNTLGQLSPCCDFESAEIFTNLKEYQTSLYLKQVKDTLDSGNFPVECRKCKFKIGLAMEPYLNHFQTEDKYVVDIRDRYCNFRCLTCSSFASTAHDINFPEIRYKVENNLEDILSHIKKVNGRISRVYFAGGEPLLQNLTYEILKILDTDTPIYINTNLSSLKFKNIYFLDEISKFTEVSIGPSIDGTHKLAEVLRDGCVFDTFEKNLGQVRHLVRQVSVVLSAPVLANFDFIKEYWKKTHGLELRFHYHNNPNDKFPIHPAYYTNSFLDFCEEKNNFIPKEILEAYRNEKKLVAKLDLNLKLKLASAGVSIEHFRNTIL